MADMPTWIIDDGPFDHLALAINASALGAWPADQFFVADATANAASGLRRALLDATPTPFVSFDLPVDSDGFDILYKHLRRPTSSTANLAEHESIAWALTDRPDAIFVAVDKRAALLALAELGCGRVAHAFDLWIHLRDQGLISQVQFEKLCEMTLNKDQSLPGVPRRCQPPLGGSS